jgi:hypothetical protein
LQAFFLIWIESLKLPFLRSDQLSLIATLKMKNVRLVLGSGGARGMAHIGVIEELEKSGFTLLKKWWAARWVL